MNKLIALSVLALTLSACGSRNVKVLDANWTSMKHAMPPAPNQTLQRVSKIQAEFCMEAWSGNYGLMDEAVKKAEAQYEIDYIKYPAFTQSIGKPCVQVAGEGYRIVK